MNQEKLLADDSAPNETSPDDKAPDAKSSVIRKLYSVASGFNLHAERYFEFFEGKGLLTGKIKDIYIEIAAYLLGTFGELKFNRYISAGHVMCFTLLHKILKYYKDKDGIDPIELHNMTQYTNAHRFLDIILNISGGTCTFSWKRQFENETFPLTIKHIEERMILRSVINDIRETLKNKRRLSMCGSDYPNNPFMDVYLYGDTPLTRVNHERLMAFCGKVALEFSEVLISLMENAAAIND